MKSIYRMVVAAAALMIGCSIANATDARQAIRMCDKNPKCSARVNDNGSVDLAVNGNYIHCPQEGQCVCDVCSPPPSRLKPTGVRNPDKVAKTLAVAR